MTCAGSLGTVPVVPTEPEINKQRLYEAKLEPYRISATAVAAPARQYASADDIAIVDAANAGLERAAPQPAQADEPVQRTAEMPLTRAEQSSDKPPSFGQALIASGVIPPPASSRADPLAPFRRMSQAEKVALFT